MQCTKKPGAETRQFRQNKEYMQMKKPHGKKGSHGAMKEPLTV